MNSDIYTAKHNGAYAARHVLWLPKNNPLTALGILAASLHLFIFFLYLGDRLASPLPYKPGSNNIRDFVHSPILPYVHLAAGLLMILAIGFPRIRQSVSLVTFTVLGSHAVILVYSAQSHLPPGSLLGVVLMFFATAVSSVLVASWGAEISEDA